MIAAGRVLVLMAVAVVLAVGAFGLPKRYD